jgi:hypothetical protein
MQLLMSSKIVFARESLSTLETLLVSHSSVTFLVISQDHLSREALSTDRACESCFRTFSNHLVETFSEVANLRMKGSRVSSTVLAEDLGWDQCAELTFQDPWSWQTLRPPDSRSPRTDKAADGVRHGVFATLQS